MPGALTLIWMMALAVMTFACAVLAALIAARVWRYYEERANPGRRSAVSEALLDYVVKNGSRPNLAMSNRIERMTVLETALDALPIMRAAGKQRMLDFLREIGLDRRLRRQARRGNVRERLSALEALVLFPDEETIATLQRIERSQDLRIWLAALRTLTLIGAGPDMLGLLQRVERPSARRSPAMLSLLLARAEAAPAEALNALRKNLPDSTRALLIRVIGETGRIEALAPLQTALLSTDPATRSAAAEALGALGFDGATASLARATRDADWRVRLKACEAIGKLGLWRQAPCLMPLLSDPVWWVRFRAEEALRRLGDDGVRALKQVGSASDDKGEAAAPVRARS